ncbi:SAM-dependent methyltransferase [Rummeliibacillus sp. JY-2-4R]
MYDQQYDQLLHIHTTRDQQSLPMFTNYYPYEPTPYAVLDFCFDKIEFETDDRLIDFGCGKGRVAFYVNHRFHVETLGIELNENYIQDALENKVHYSKEHRLLNAPISFLCMKAEEYIIQPQDNIFFFFHPFSIEIFQKVIINIVKSYQAHSRKIYVMLYYPSFDYIRFLRNETQFMVVRDVLIPNVSLYNRHERIMIFEYCEEF